MERARKISKKYYLRQIMACWLSCWMLFGIPVQVVMADPNPGGSVVPGSGNVISTSPGTGLGWTGGGTDVGINSNAGNNIITWNNFDIGENATLTFNQASGWVLNNVQAADAKATGIFGGLFGPDCGLIVVNPLGVVFGPASLVEAQNFIASSLQMSTTDFTNGVLRFTDGDIAGDVTNNGTILAGHMAALVGKNVYNRGHIAGEYVIMAAGETVLITESSAVVVEVALDGDPANYLAENEDTIGDYHNKYDVDTKHVILAAGDVWSAGIEGVETLRAEAIGGDVYFDGEVDVYAEAASDAVADITIITGGDYTVDSDNSLYADAVGNGVDNATAKITIDAGGNVTVEDSGEVIADARDGSTNNAGVEIIADGDVKVLGDDYDTYVDAYAYNGLNNNANIEITAGGKVDVIAEDWGEAEIYAEAGGGTIDALSNNASIKVTANDGRVFVHGVEENSYAGIYAEAYDGVDNTATVEVTAKGEDGDVKVVAADGGSANIGADAYYADNKNSAGITINADGDVLVKAKEDGWAGIWAQANNDDEENEASITIIAGGNVEVFAGSDEDSDSTALIGAWAWDGFENSADVTITTEDGYVLVHGIGEYDDEPSEALITAVAEDAESKNTANVTITANGCEDCDREEGDKEGDVLVIAVDGGKAEIEAIAKNSPTNTADVTINADYEVKVIAKGYGSGPESEAEIMALAKNDGDVEDYLMGELDYVVNGDEIASGTLEGFENTATVNITASNVEVIGEDRGEAEITAIAKNEIEIPNLEADVLNLGIQDFGNTAGVTITTNAILGVESGDVLVTAEEGGTASIGAEAKNKIDDDSGDLTVNLTVGDVENDADVVIDAGADVEVTASGRNQGASEAEIGAEAENEVDYVNLTVDGPVNNTADVDITTGYDVEVEAEDGARAEIGAGAENELNIFSFGDLISDDGVIENTAKVKIDAGSDVKVIAYGVGHGNPSEATIKAEADWATNNTADVTIDAGCDVEVSGGVDDRRGIAGIEATAERAMNNNTADITITADNVKVISGNPEEGYKGTAEIIAEAKYAENKNSADVTITADGDVLVHGGTSEETAKIIALAEHGYDNTANIGIDAGGNVEVIAGSEEHEHRGKAEIVAEATEADNKNTAGVTITAGGDVKVIDFYGGDTAKIQALANNHITVWDSQTVEGLENIATIDITATNVEVRGEYYGHAYIEADAHNLIYIEYAGGTIDLTIGDLKNTADVTITTTGVDEGIDVTDGDGDVLVIAEEGGEADIDAEAFNEIMQENDDDVDLTVGLLANKADVVIDATGDVAVHAFGSWDSADIDAEAQNMLTGSYYYYLDIVGEQGPITNNATVDIATGDTVEVVGINGDAKINAEAWNYNEDDYAEHGGQVERWPLPVDFEFPEVKDNFATILIDAGGDVIVKGGEVVGESLYGGDAEIEALARYGVNNDATVDIDAVGDVRVTDIGGEHTAKIEAIAMDAIKSNTANVLIGAIDNYVGGNVEVTAGELDRAPGGTAYIKAVAKNAYGDFGENGDEGENTANVEIFTDGDVEVTGVEGGDASIAAGSWDAYTNNSDVLICADSVLVQGSSEGARLEPYGTAEIKAIAHNGENNNAYVGIGASGDVEVLTIWDGDASIAAKAFNLWDPALSNNADVVICADGSVAVIDKGYLGDTAEIFAEADYGISNTATVGICADHDADGDGDVLVAADNGGEAWIYAEAYADDYSYGEGPDEVLTSADAKVIVVSHAGSVGVVALMGSEAGIEAYAENAYYTTADVGIAAGPDLAPAAVPALEEPDVLPEDIDDLLGLLPPGNVVVYGDGSSAYIEAYAEGGVENTADTVVCAPGTVAVIAAEGDAYIWAAAGGEESLVDSATTQVYASDIIVSEHAWVGAETPEGEASVTGWSLGDPVPPSEDGATLILDDYSVRKDCPDCLPCPICDLAEAFLAPAAPLGELIIPMVLGCPAEMEAAAGELGLTPEMLQVAMAGALAQNPSMQPCEACRTLINSAAILSDADGSRMAAMVQTFNTLAPADAPFTPGMAASIATAFAEGLADPEAPQYATAMEYVDAFVAYVTVLETELGAPVGDSAEFAMAKYGTPLTESGNANIASYIEARLAGLGG